MNFYQIALVAFIVESLWETCKLFWDKGKLNLNRIGVLAFSELVTIGGNIDLFKTMNIEIHIPLLGSILTGILISRGSNFVHSLISFTENINNNIKNPNPPAQ